jgi:hypothetical protein
MQDSKSYRSWYYTPLWNAGMRRRKRNFSFANHFAGILQEWKHPLQPHVFTKTEARPIINQLVALGPL